MQRSAAVFLGTCLISVAAGTAPGDAAARATRSATCDQLVGQTLARNDVWRVFNPGRDIESLSPVWACRRSQRPVSRVTSLGAWASAPVLAGDLLQVNNEGRYDNCGGYVVHLPTLRATISRDCAPPKRDDVLLGSGAIVSVLETGPLDRAPDGRPAPAQVGSSPLTVYDGRGETVIAPAGATQVAPPLGATIVPFARTGSDPAGFYFSGSDGVLRRAATTGAADPSGWQPLSGAALIRHRERVRKVAGIDTIYTSVYELRRVRAKRGRQASLTLRYPNSETLVRGSSASDLRARLAPGSETDLRTFGPLIVGRFVDDPQALRVRTGSSSTRYPASVDLPAPSIIDASTFIGGADPGIRRGDVVTVLTSRYRDGSYVPVSVGVPAGATNLVTRASSTASAQDASGQLLFTKADGTPGSVDYERPGR